MTAGFTDADLVAILPGLRGRAYALSRSHAQADDLAQTTALRALTNRDRFTGTREDLRRWCFTIMRNEFFNIARASARRPMVDIEEVVNVGVRGNQEDSVYLAEVSRLADALPYEQAQAIALGAICGLGMVELSETLKVAEGTVKSRLSRARATLEDQTR